MYSLSHSHFTLAKRRTRKQTVNSRESVSFLVDDNSTQHDGDDLTAFSKSLHSTLTIHAPTKHQNQLVLPESDS